MRQYKGNLKELKGAPVSPSHRVSSSFLPTQNPVQEWGEEFEEGALYGITLRREPVQIPASPTDARPCMAFVQYRTCKVRRLKAATLNRLVSHLLDPCCQEPDYRQIFLSTYQTFTTTSALIELLFQRWAMSLSLQYS